MEDVDATLQVSDKDDVEEDEGVDDDEADSDEEALSAATGRQAAAAQQDLQDSRLGTRFTCTQQHARVRAQHLFTQFWQLLSQLLHCMPCRHRFNKHLLSEAQSLLNDGCSSRCSS